LTTPKRVLGLFSLHMRRNIY